LVRAKWTAFVASLGLALATVGPALAVPGPDQQLQNAQKLNRLGVVQGTGVSPSTGQTEFNLGAPITRAELVTTIVRSFGLESAAQTAKGAPSFPDVQADAWFSGYVAVAKNLAGQKGIAIGRSVAQFDPNAAVTRVEALVFVLKFLGINASGSSTPWYEGWIQEAVGRGVLTQADRTDLLADPEGGAPRGEAFMILDKGYGAKVLTGSQSLYTTYLDPLAPTLAVMSLPASTSDATITLTGSVTDNKGIATFSINGMPMTLTGSSFSVKEELAPGANAFELRAVDLAGNETSQLVTISRTAAEPASIEVAPLEVPAGSTVTVNAVVKDAAGTVIPGVALVGTSNVGTYANGQFTANTTVGSGTLTLKASNGTTKQVAATVVAGPVAKVVAARTVAPGEFVTLSTTDAYGNAITGAKFTQSSPDGLVTEAGVFTGSAPGSYTVKATKDGVAAEGQVGVYGAPKALHFVPGQPLVANNSSTYSIQVEIVDANGYRVSNYGQQGSVQSVDISSPGGLTFSATLAQPSQGVATFTVKADASLADTTVSLDATFHTTSAVHGSGEITVEAQRPTTIQITAPAVHRVNNSDPSAITVELLDQVGKPMVDGAYEFTLGVDGAATLADGQRTGTLPWTPMSKTFEIVSVNAATTGPVTLTVSGEGLLEAKATIQAQYATSPTQLQLQSVGASSVDALNPDDAGVASTAAASGDALKYEVTVVDDRSVPVDQNTARIALEFTGVSAPDQAAVSVDGVTWVALSAYSGSTDPLTIANGKATFYLLSSQPGTFQVRAKEYQDGPSGYPELGLRDSGSVPAMIDAGQAAMARFEAPGTLYLLRGSPTRGNVTVQVTDTAGNPVRQAGVSVAVTATESNAQLNGTAGSGTAVTDANGKAVFALTASASLEEVHLTLSDLSWSGGTVTVDPVHNELLVKAQYQLPKSVSLVVKRNDIQPATLTVGESFTVQATVRDQDGQPYDGLLPSDFLFTINGQVQPFTASSDAVGVYSTTVPDGAIYRDGNVTLAVSLTGQASPVSGTKSIGVKAGAPASIRLAEATWTDDGNHLYEVGSDTFTVHAGKDQDKTYTIQVVDKYGNLIIPTSLSNPLTIGLSSLAPSGGYIAITNVGGVPLTDLTIGAGHNSATIHVRSNKGGTLILTSSLDNLSVTLIIP
jgi:hypothetical protein